MNIDEKMKLKRATDAFALENVIESQYSASAHTHAHIYTYTVIWIVGRVQLFWFYKQQTNASDKTGNSKNINEFD